MVVQEILPPTSTQLSWRPLHPDLGNKKKRTHIHMYSISRDTMTSPLRLPGSRRVRCAPRARKRHEERLMILPLARTLLVDKAFAGLMM